MRFAQRKRWLMGVAVLVGASPSWAGTPPPLRFDPFRPEPEKIEVAGTPLRPTRDDAFQPVLLSTVVGGERPLVNLGGVILSVGEETHGYRLLEVRAFDATFERNGETLTLEVVTGSGDRT